MCAQRRLRAAWASAQSDQSLRCPHEESLGPYLPTEHTAKALIGLGGCPGLSESSLGAQSFCWVCHEAAHMKNKDAAQPAHPCSLISSSDVLFLDSTNPIDDMVKFPDSC